MKPIASLLFLPGFLALLAIGGTLSAQTGGQPQATKEFSKGTATSSEECGACHKAIYREYATGFGSDLVYKQVVYKARGDKVLTMPAATSTSAVRTAHSGAGVDQFPIHAREVEAGGKSCNVCHYPKSFSLPDMENLEMGKPEPRPAGEEAGGVTCASCHLTPDGKIRAAHQVNAPHATVVVPENMTPEGTVKAHQAAAPQATAGEPAIRTAVMCAYCHAKGKRVPGMQTNTFFEWREDFHKAGLGGQQCQDCHMPRTLRKVAEDYDVPKRAVARHLWTGGHSMTRVASAVNVAVVQPVAGKGAFEFHVINVGAGHSVPTGSNRRAVYLKAQAVDGAGKVLAERQWMFAPWYAERPDDKKFLESDKGLPDAQSAMQADAQGPHEAPLQAGEERVLAWDPGLKDAEYSVQASLVYDLNRYNDTAYLEDQTIVQRAGLKFQK